jgi:hypothetical protein
MHTYISVYTNMHIWTLLTVYHYVLRLPHVYTNYTQTYIHKVYIVYSRRMAYTEVGAPLLVFHMRVIDPCLK